jgi:hypothetical protein
VIASFPTTGWLPSLLRYPAVSPNLDLDPLYIILPFTRLAQLQTDQFVAVEVIAEHKRNGSPLGPHRLPLVPEEEDIHKASWQPSEPARRSVPLAIQQRLFDSDELLSAFLAVHSPSRAPRWFLPTTSPGSPRDRQ